MGNATTMFAQNFNNYYIEIKDGYELGVITKTTNPDQTLTLSMANTSLATLLNAKSMYEFKEAFPGAQNSRLQKTYLMSLVQGEVVSDLSSRQEVNNIFFLDDIELADEPVPDYTDDYIELLYDNLPNTVLELIEAPLAWSVDKGDSSILIGIVDSHFDVNHEDLQGQIVLDLDDSPSTQSHGTGVASLAGAKNNNGKGMSSIAGWENKLVTADLYGLGVSRVWEVAQIPGVKVINCSWGRTTYNELDDLACEEITQNGVLIVCAAHNQGTTTYYYPASYDSTLSVTGVGQRYSMDYNNPYFWGRSWKDVHEFRPDTDPNHQSQNHNDKVDVCAPGHRYLAATDDYVNYPLGYKTGTGTSGSSPITAGLAALIFSVNPNLTAYEVKDIIRNTTDDIYYIPYNQPYVGLLGTGRINAYRAVKTAWCMDNPGAVTLDLAMQDSKKDYFEEPNTNTPVFWYSEDIWTRNQDDGILIKEHENPEYDPNNPSYVYVRVTNSSCVVNSGTEELKLYWSKANTALAWPDHWDGSLYITDPVTGQNILMGDEVGTLTIPPLNPGESTVLKFEWNVPNPEDYVNINSNPWHFCLLGRIVTPEDPMTTTETADLAANILNNNNIVLKNTTVVDIIADVQDPVPVGGVVMVGNPTTQQKTYALEFNPPPNEFGKAIYDEAEVTATLDTVLYSAWDTGGKTLQSAEEIKPKVIQLNDSTATIGNITLNPGEMGTVYVAFNFLSKELTEKRRFTYHLMQKDTQTNTVIGGETFEIRKQFNTSLTAYAGNDKEVNKNESITISANDIGESVTYNWYDPQGNLIYTGTDLTITPQMTQTYKLEVVSDIDGLKDYDEVTITVNPYYIDTLVPNPAISQVTVNYEIAGSTSAYLMVVNTNTGSSDNYILDTTTTSATIDVSTYTTGLYNIVLVCDGATQNAKTLVKN